MKIPAFFKDALAPQEKPDPLGPYRGESARLMAELDQGHHRELRLRNTTAQLTAENQRLTAENQRLRHSQQETLIEELADRLLAQKTARETPAVTLPCSHHRTAGLNFAAWPRRPAHRQDHTAAGERL